MKSVKKIIAAILAAAAVLTVSAANVSADDYGDILEIDAEIEPVEEYADFNFYWKEPEKFSESLVPTFEAKAVSDGVAFNLEFADGADFIRIYRYDAAKKNYVFLADSYTTYYCDTTAKALTSYSYKVRMYTSDGKKTKLSKAVKVKTPFLSGAANAAVSSSQIKIFWNKNSAADGYEIYYYKAKAGSRKNFYTVYGGGNIVCYNEKDGNLEKVAKKEFKKLKSTKETSYAVKRDKNYDYYFKIRAYAVKDGKKVYSDFSDISASTSSVSLFNGAKGKSKSTVPVISYRSDVSGWTMSISAADKKVMDEFMKTNFKSGMSDFDKMKYLTEYIHYSVDYADGNTLNKISNMSCIEAAVVNRAGQCYQYNGALAEFLAYMGYDVRLVCGYRESVYSGSRISHYWCEVTLDGTKYVIDAGNIKDGLYKLCLPYECADGYILNQ